MGKMAASGLVSSRKHHILRRPSWSGSLRLRRIKLFIKFQLLEALYPRTVRSCDAITRASSTVTESTVLWKSEFLWNLLQLTKDGSLILSPWNLFSHMSEPNSRTTRFDSTPSASSHIQHHREIYQFLPITHPNENYTYYVMMNFLI